MRSRYNRTVQRMKDKMKAKNQEKDAAAEECIMTPEQQHQRDFLDAMAHAKLWTPNTPNRNASSISAESLHSDLVRYFEEKGKDVLRSLRDEYIRDQRGHRLRDLDWEREYERTLVGSSRDSWRDIILSGRWLVDEQHAEVAYAEPTEFLLEEPMVRIQNGDDISFFQKVYYGPHQEGYVKLEELDIPEGDDNALNAYLGVACATPGK